MPEWVKRDQERFPRALRTNGAGNERLSPLSEKNVKADAKAFAALMRHIKQVDGERHIVGIASIDAGRFKDGK